MNDAIFIEKNMRYLDVMKFKHNLKGTGQHEYYLGGYIEVGRHGRMEWSTKSYIMQLTGLKNCWGPS